MQETPDAKMLMVRGRYRTLLVIWVAILWSIVIILALPLIIKRTTQPGLDQRLYLVLLGLSLAAVAVSFIIKGILLMRAGQAQSIDLAIKAYILAFALCESSSIFGIVAYFIGASHYYYLFIPGPLCMLLHMPRRERLLAITYKPQG